MIERTKHCCFFLELFLHDYEICMSYIAFEHGFIYLERFELFYFRNMCIFFLLVGILYTNIRLFLFEISLINLSTLL